MKKNLVRFSLIVLACCGNPEPSPDTNTTNIPPVSEDATIIAEDVPSSPRPSVDASPIAEIPRKDELPSPILDKGSVAPDSTIPDSNQLDSSSPSFIPPGYTLKWEDSFDGPEINTDNWVVASLKDPITGDLVPGAKGDHLLNDSYAGYITEEDTYIDDGILVLRNQKRSYQGQNPAGDYSYTSGWVMSMHRVHFNKGYLEFRAKFPSGDKVWPALWLISEQLQWCPEWDMWEYFGFREDLVSPKDNMGTHLCYDAWPNQKWSSNFINGFDLQYDCESWHIYGFEWTATESRWFLDGQLMHTITKASLGDHQHLWPDEEMYIVLNNGQKTSSPDETTTWPNTLEIDYVRLYESD